MAKARTPNHVLWRIREEELKLSRDKFAAAIAALGPDTAGCDARLVARWERGEVDDPRGVYKLALEEVTGYAFADLGFPPKRNAMQMPSSDGFSLEKLSFYVDETGQVWASVDRRSFLVGSAATLLAQGVPLGRTPILGETDVYGFAALVQANWPELRLSRPSPDYGVDYTALLPPGRSLSGALMRLQLNPAHVGDGKATVDLASAPRWAEFSAGTGRGLLVGVEGSRDHPRAFVIDAREAGRRASARGKTAVAIPAAYELDDFTYGLLWACNSLDDGLQADDQEITLSRQELSAYETLQSSAVSKEAVPDLGSTSTMWLGSDFCARHIVRNLTAMGGVPLFWTREQRGEEACTWLLFEHKYEYLLATSSSDHEPSSRAFCIPKAVVSKSPRYERILLFLAVALMEATGIHAKISDDPTYEDVEGFVLPSGQDAIIANWVRGAGMWHVDTTRRPSVLNDFREVIGETGAASIIDAPTPETRLRAFAEYLELPWEWLTRRCRDVARVGSGAMLRPRSRLMSVRGLDVSCTFVGNFT